MIAMNASTSARFSNVPARFAARATATTKARMTQALTSPTAAQVSAVLPNAVRDRLRSFRMRASTGNAVMLMDMPMNSAKVVKLVPGAARPANRK